MRHTKSGSLGPDLVEARHRPRPRPASYGTPWAIVLIAGDVAVAVAAWAVAAALARVPFDAPVYRDDALQTVLFALVVWLLLVERIGLYRRSFSTHARDEGYASLAASSIAMTPAVVLFALLPAVAALRPALFLALALTAVGVSGVRVAGHVVRRRVLPAAPRRMAVIGTPERVNAVPEELSLTAADFVLRLPIDDFDDEAVAGGADPEQLEWLQFALQQGCTEIVITETLPPDMMPALLRYTEARGVKLAFAPMRIRPHACDFQVRRDGGLALLYPRTLVICTPGAELVRRVIDLALAIPALVALSPLLAVVALAVRLDSGAPVFYTQTRVGKLGREFEIVKFRTMRVDAEAASGPVWARSGEDRTTRIGKFLRRFSLDELPQLFNIVRGDMAVVGPRPERPFYVEQFRRMLRRYDERHLVRPGITGWAQISMRRVLDPTEIGEKLSYDLFYLEHWSVFMDVLVVCKTAFEFLFHSAA